MSERITDFAEVEYFVPSGMALPKEIEDYLKLCACKFGTLNRKEGRMYNIPHYLMTQWLEKFGQVTA